MVEYRDITGHPGYRVGDDGTVWRHYAGSPDRPNRRPPRWKQLRPKSQYSGHKSVSLAAAGGPVYRRVHRLVLEAFVGPCPPGMECCHNDGDPANNRLQNLRWDTRKANRADQLAHGTRVRGESIPWSRLTAAAVAEIRRLRVAGRGYAWLASRFGVGKTTVRAAIEGRSWAHVAALVGGGDAEGDDDADD